MRASVFSFRFSERAAALFALAAGLLAWGAQGATVRDVRVAAMGTVPVNAAEVLAKVRSRPGMELDRGLLASDVRQLQGAGVYSYVESRLENAPGGEYDLVFHVMGRPRIRKLTVEGAEYYNNKKIKKLMEISSGDRIDGALMGEKAQAVREKYRKAFFHDIQVTWDLSPVVDEPGFTDVTVHVKEGERSLVRKIKFRGAKHVSARELRKAMVQKQQSWLTIFNNDGEYLPGELLTDRESIRKVYLDKGYLGVQVSAPMKVRRNKKKIDILFEIEEGPLYTLEDWRITGMKLFPVEEAAAGVTAAKGQPARLEEIQKSARNVADYYGAKGYIRTTAEPRVALDTNRATARVTYAVEEGELAYIQDIDIRGNTATKDKVIRREISVRPGQVYNSPKVRASENRVRNLNYFSYVRAYPEETAVSNRYRIVFDVEEKSTGAITFGAGFSSVDNLIGFVEFSQGNFDLYDWRTFRGGGQKLKIRLQLGSEREDVDFSWIEPWFLNRRLSLGLNAFWREASYYSDEYDQRTAGGTVTFGKSLTVFDRVNLIYGLQDISIDNVKTNASSWIFEEEGGRLKSYGTVELVRETRDNFFVSTRGFRGSVAATLAGGPFGGETDNYEFTARGSQYFPLWFGHVINFRGGASMVEEYGDSDRVPIFDRQFLGGPRSVRAFKYRKVGPKDEEGEARGGRSSAWFSAEYLIPVASMLRLAAFYDGGVVWQGIFKEEEMSVPVVGDGVWCDGVGVGIRLDVPGLPIQLDYAWPLTTDEMLPDHGRISFNIGYSY